MNPAEQSDSDICNLQNDSNICTLQNGSNMCSLQKESNVDMLPMSDENMGEQMSLYKDLSLSQEKTKDSREAELFQCNKCERTFKQKSRYERHMNNHPSEKHYLCNTCHKKFTRMSHLEKHIRTHTEERRHVCGICGAAFILPHHLVRHNLVHTGIRPFECKTCHKQFTRKAGLAQHEYVHTGLRPYICDVGTCGKQFTDRSTLRRHLLTHSREKPFLCKECGKTFRTKSACRKHYLRHFKGIDSFKCGICEEMFVSEDLLEKHVVIHEEKQKVGAPSYRCGFCLRVFISQSDLDVHVPLHQTGMKFSCDQCSAKFYTQSDLIGHTEKHEINMRGTDQVYTQLPEPTTFIENISPNKEDKPNVSSLTISASPTSDCSKLVVVLQLPPSTSCIKNSDGNLELSNLQQLLGNAQIDKLLVTTDPVTDSPSTLAFQLSQHQQEGIQQILQTTSLNTVEYLRSDPEIHPITEISSLNQISSSCTIHGHNGSSELNGIHSPYVLKDGTTGTEELREKDNSAYIIVPSYEDNASSTMSFTSSDEYKVMVRNEHLPKLGSESVFLSSKNIIQRVLIPSETKDVVEQPLTEVSSIPGFDNQAISNGSSFPLGADIRGSINISSNVVSAVDRRINSITLEDRQNNKTFFTADEFDRDLDERVILPERENAFTIVSSG